MLGRGPILFSLHAQGHIQLVQQQAGRSQHRVQDPAHVQMVPSAAAKGDHLAHFGHRLACGRLPPQRFRPARVGEPGLKARRRQPIGQEGGRIGEDGLSALIEQRDQCGRVAKGFHSPAFFRLDLQEGRFEQQDRATILQPIA